MSALGSKLRRVESGIVLFWCPGCDSAHQIRVDSAFGSAWGFNGSGDAPTFTPSVLVRSGHFVEPQGKHCDKSGDPEWPCSCVCCHSFVTDGRIQFLADSTHHLADQTVDLPDWPGWGGIE